MVGVGRDLCGSSSPTPLLKQGHPEQAAEDLAQAGLEYLQRRRPHSLPGQPVPVLHHPQREEVQGSRQVQWTVLLQIAHGEVSERNSVHSAKPQLSKHVPCVHATREKRSKSLVLKVRRSLSL